MTMKSHDHLTTTTDQGKIELREEELSRVTGGAAKKGGTKPVEYLKIEMHDIFITS